MRKLALAKNIISAVPGYMAHDLRRCIDVRNKYLPLVRWPRLEDHTEGYHKSAEYQEWKRLLHHFYEPIPIVEHFNAI